MVDGVKELTDELRLLSHGATAELDRITGKIRIFRGQTEISLESLGRIPTRAQARVSARPATASERKLLGLGPHGVVLSERRTIDDQDGIPIEHTETLYAAERYEFEAVLQRGDDAVVH